MFVRSTLVALLCGAAVTTVQANEIAPARLFSWHVDGYAGIYGFLRDSFNPRVSPDRTALGLVARLNVPVTAGWNVQLDGAYDNDVNGLRFSLPGDPDDTRHDLESFGGATHLYWRDPERFAAGVFASYTHFETFDLTSYDPVGDTYTAGKFGNSRLSGGVEGQYFWGPVTLYGQGYVGERRGSAFVDTGLARAQLQYDFWGVRAIARYFPIANLKLEAEVGYAQEQISSNPDLSNYTTNTVRLAAQATYRFAETPFAIHARYQFEDPSQEGGEIFGIAPASTQKILVGLRMAFGSSTLLEEDRNGASLDTAQRNSVLRR